MPPDPSNPAFDCVDGIFVPRPAPQHRNEEYDEQGFDMLLKMQREHFWYVGRHRLLLNVLKKELAHRNGARDALCAIDLGGGCGGWVEYLHQYLPDTFQELALGDSSQRALKLAEPVVGAYANRYQVDLMDLPWKDKWDVVFLLDVIEHLPDDAEVLRQALACVKPGGLVVVTAPALKAFWTYNDEVAKHQRRYCRRDFQALSKTTGAELLRLQYFMFALSPMLFLNRILFRPKHGASDDEMRAYVERSHAVPSRPANALLTGVLLAEAWLANVVSFPWGSSVAGVFRRMPPDL
jgi:SAM-dependent methyltransferase